MNLKELRVNGKRLQQSLEEMARIGATPAGGVQRLTLSDEDKQARDLFIKWLNELDLEITIDEMGNIFGKKSLTGLFPNGIENGLIDRHGPKRSFKIFISKGNPPF